MCWRELGSRKITGKWSLGSRDGCHVEGCLGVTEEGLGAGDNSGRDQEQRKVTLSY